MNEPIDIMNAIYEAVKELIEKNDNDLRIVIDMSNPIHVWICNDGDRRYPTANYKWYSSKMLITKGMPNMSKIGEIALECYEATKPIVKVGKLPSTHNMIKALCKCHDCAIDISEASTSEVKKKYAFLVSVGAIKI
ncbi:MAG: hypothetical protein PHC48_07230 [Prevotella sp.]|nr:hypothetical protein [Prevotella sp.]